LHWYICYLGSCTEYFAGCTDGDICLFGGANIYEGRVEVCHEDVWGTVYNDDWDNNDGFVACHQLVYHLKELIHLFLLGKE